LDQKVEQVALRFSNSLRERTVRLHAVVAGRDLPLPHPSDGGSDRDFRLLGVSAKDSQRAAMRGQFLHVEERNAMSGENPLDRAEREVAVVLLVDRVELIAFDQVYQVGKFNGQHAS